MLERLRRASAALTALALVAGAIAQAPQGCGECAPGCPMHSARPEQPGCHRARATAPAATPSPAADCSLRASCGHADGSLTSRPAMLAAAATPIVRWRTFDVAPAPMAPVGGDAPAPPTEPPRLLSA